jgi:hypothetical protein
MMSAVSSEHFDPSTPIVIGPSLALPRSGADILRVVLRRARLASMARLMFLQWPQARTITESLAWHLTDLLVHPGGGSLLGMCVLKGFDVMACTLNARPDDDKLHPEVLVAYLAGLFEHVAVLPEIEVRDARARTWDLLRDGPLGAWIGRARPVTIQFLPELPPAALGFSPPNLRMAILQRVVPPDVLRGLHAHLGTITDPPY